jgi:pyruvate/2-oxoglutarate dehydrogenase complex dihydrolipoamide acyltransferase (E2) component
MNGWSDGEQSSGRRCSGKKDLGQRSVPDSSATMRTADLIGSYHETAFPLIQRSVGDIFTLSRSKYYVTGLLEIDVTRAREVIDRHETETGETISFTGWMARCLAQAISEFPETNSYRKGGRRVVTFQDVDVLVVVEKGVGVKRRPLPYVIRKANEKTVEAIHDEIRRAQTGNFQDEDSAIREEASRDRKSNPFKIKRIMGTTGISSVGMFTAGGGWPIVPGTHTIDLGVGGIARKPGVVGDQIAIREFLDLSIQIDHEMIDGAPAARFAARLSELMESAFELQTVSAISEPDSAA